ncbi:MAG: hypothetical protein FJW68_02475 [Actinobacteria bacterium]|nr:hypothetical protein [Actinomycetota bacterium]
MNKKSRAALIALTAVFIFSFVLMIPAAIFAEEEAEEVIIETIDIPEELEFNVVYPKLSAKAGNNFEFSVDLTYVGDEEATIDLFAEGPENWFVAVTPSYQDSQITAVKLTPGKKESLKIKVFPSIIKEFQKPGDYEIIVRAENEDLKLSEEISLTATITATYSLDLNAKFGVLNTKATSGKNNPYTIVLKNSGSDVIENITFGSDAPQKWIVKFNPEKIDKLNADESKDIEITITPPDKTIAGDYMLNFSVKSAEATKNIDVRVTVETPSIWGWVGIAIIVIVVIGVAVIFARLGRR